MFESLDKNLLSQFSRIDDKQAIKEELQLSQLLSCLDDAQTECKVGSLVMDGNFDSSQQVIIGIEAAKKILIKIWQNVENNSESGAGVVE